MNLRTDLHAGQTLQLDPNQLAAALQSVGAQVSPAQVSALLNMVGSNIDPNQLAFLLSMYGVNTAQLNQAIQSLQLPAVQ